MLDLYTNIKKYRKQLNMSQSELAKRVGYTDKSMVSQIERGKVNLSEAKIMQFAAALDVSPQTLMGWEEDPYYEMGYKTADTVSFIMKTLSSGDVSVDFTSINKKYAQLLPEARIELENYADLLLLKQSVNESNNKLL